MPAERKFYELEEVIEPEIANYIEDSTEWEIRDLYSSDETKYSAHIVNENLNWELEVYFDGELSFLCEIRNYIQKLFYPTNEQDKEETKRIRTKEQKDSIEKFYDEFCEVAKDIVETNSDMCVVTFI